MTRRVLATAVALLVLSTAAVGPAAAASLSITDVSIPDSVSQGDEFEVVVSVSGSDVENVDASLSLPDGISCSPSGTQAVGLDDGSGQATFECDADATGDYAGEITASVTGDETESGNTRSDSTQTGLDVLSPASLTLSSSLGSSTVDTGEATSLDVVVQNSGDSSTTYTVSVGSSAGYSTTVTAGSTSGDVGGDSTRTISYDVTGDSAGDYTLTVTVDGGNGQSLSESHDLSVQESTESSGGSGGGSSGSYSVSAGVVTDTPDPTPTATPSSSADETPSPAPTDTATPDDASDGGDGEAVGTDATPTPTPSSGAGPGFTAIGSVTALVVALVLARRRLA